MLARPARPLRVVSLVPLIDVLFILLIYFMVTSVYLDLDMIPASGSSEAPAGTGAGEVGTTARLIRLDRHGRAVVGGISLPVEELAPLLSAELAQSPDLSVLILPSPYAPMQSLAGALDAVVAAGVKNSRILNLEAEE